MGTGLCLVLAYTKSTDMIIFAHVSQRPSAFISLSYTINSASVSM